MSTWTRTHRLVIVALGILAFAMAGCGDDDDGNNGDDGGTGPTGGGSEITSANIGAVQAQVTSALTSAVVKGPGTYNGAESGTVTISLAKPAQISLNYRLVFDNYSDDGEVYIDGVVTYSLSSTGSDTGSDTNLHYVLDVAISGAYSGDVEGEMNVSGGAPSGYWVVDGTRINF